MESEHISNFGCNVYVAGLPPEFSDQQLHDLFISFGPIISARIMRAKATRASKGYGFVLFEDIKSASQAVTALNGVILSGHRIQARLAHPDASSTLRKFPKRSSSSAASKEHSTTASPLFQGLSGQVALPIMTAAPQPLVPTNYPFPAGTPLNRNGSQSFAASSTLLANNNPSNNCNVNGSTSVTMPQQLFSAATFQPFNGAAVAAANSTTPPTFGLNSFPPNASAVSTPFGTPQFILPQQQQQQQQQQQPVFIVMLSQDMQPTVNYPM